MFGIESTELAIIALVALLVIGPKDLPRVMRQVGNWMAKGRAMTRHVRAGFDTMMREAELEEMQKQWAAQNEAIMKATALPDLTPDLGLADLSTDTWMTPSPPEAAAVEPPPALPAAEVPALPKPNRKARTTAPEAGETAAPKRKRKAKVAAEPAPLDP